MESRDRPEGNIQVDTRSDPITVEAPVVVPFFRGVARILRTRAPIEDPLGRREKGVDEQGQVNGHAGLAETSSKAQAAAENRRECRRPSQEGSSCHLVSPDAAEAVVQDHLYSD